MVGAFPTVIALGRAHTAVESSGERATTEVGDTRGLNTRARHTSDLTSRQLPRVRFT